MCLLQMHSLHANASYAFHVLKDTSNKKVKKFYLRNTKDLGMTCHVPPLKIAQRRWHYPLSVTSPFPEFSILWDGTEEG